MPIKFISAAPTGLAPSSSCFRTRIDGRESLPRAMVALVGLSLPVAPKTGRTAGYSPRTCGTPESTPLPDCSLNASILQAVEFDVSLSGLCEH